MRLSSPTGAAFLRVLRFLATVFFLAADFAEFCFLGACVGRGVDGVAATQSR